MSKQVHLYLSLKPWVQCWIWWFVYNYGIGTKTLGSMYFWSNLSSGFLLWNFSCYTELDVDCRIILLRPCLAKITKLCIELIDSLDALNTAKARIASILNGLNHAFVNVAASLYTKWGLGLRLWKKNFVNKQKKRSDQMSFCLCHGNYLLHFCLILCFHFKSRLFM
jgi:hypothetical protein